MKTAAVLVLAWLLLAIPAAVADGPTDAEAKAAIKTFRTEFRAEEMSRRMQALWDLSQVRHDMVIDEIGRRVLTDPDPEVRAAGAQLLGKMKADPERAGPHLAKRLPKEEDFPEVQVAMIRAIRAIGYAGAREQLIDAAMRFAEEEYRFVTAEVLTTFGALKDVKALPFLLKLAEYNTETLRGRKGPMIRTAGSTPIPVRRRMWMKKYGKFIFPKGDPGEIVKWWLTELVTAVTAITGETFEDPLEFRKWMEANARKLRIKRAEIDKSRKLEPKPPKPAAEQDE